MSAGGTEKARKALSERDAVVVVFALEERPRLGAEHPPGTVVARDDVGQEGGVLDEARVNRLRYLEGTPKESTRWIDTGHAIRLMADTILER